jgi:hypothetical protein
VQREKKGENEVRKKKFGKRGNGSGRKGKDEEGRKKNRRRR